MSMYSDDNPDIKPRTAGKDEMSESDDDEFYGWLRGEEGSLGRGRCR
jgi:hypothetical protein